MSERTPTRPPAWAWVALLGIMALNLWLRGHTIGPTVRDALGFAPWPVVAGEAEPLDCDEAIYAYIGDRIDHGDVMYRDLTENKPPGGYWLFALAVAIGGPNETTIRLMPVPMVLAILALIWALGLRLAGPVAACLAALAYAIASTDPYLYGNGANMEHALNLFAVASLALAVWALPRRGWAFPASAGACLGAAFLVKQVAITHLPQYAFAFWLGRGKDRPTSDRVRDLAALGGGLALIVGVAVLVLVSRGAAREAFDDIVRYGGALATEMPHDPKAPPFLHRWFQGNADPSRWWSGTWPLWAAAAPALVWLWLPGSTAGRRLVAAWTLSAWVQVALPGLFWNHYYLLPLPGVCLVVGLVTGEAIEKARRPGWARRLAWGASALVGLGAIASTAEIQRRVYLMVPSEELTIRYKGGRQWATLRRMGRDLARRTKGMESPRLFVWGWQGPLYIYSGLRGVTRQVFVDPLMKAKARADPDHPQIRPRLDRTMRDLRARPPALILCGDPPFRELAAFLRANYVPSGLDAKGPNGEGLYVRSDLDRQFEPDRIPSYRRP